MIALLVFAVVVSLFTYGIWSIWRHMVNGTW